MGHPLENKWLFVAAALASCAAFASERGGEVDLAALGLGQELARAEFGDHLYLALSSGGVAVVNAKDPGAPKLERTLAPERRFVRVVVDRGVLLLIEEQNHVTAWNIGSPGSPQLAPSLAPPKPAPALAVTASSESPTAPPVGIEPSGAIKVLKVDGGRVLFDAGRAQGFEPGARVRIVSQRLVEKPDLVTGSTALVPSGEVTAVVKIDHADETRSLASLGRGDVVDAGDLASLTGEPLSEKLMIPRRAPFAWMAGFHARPFLGLNTTSKPFALLSDLYLRYYLPGAPVSFGVELSPIGFVAGGEASVPITATGYGAFSSDFFEVGLGLGGITSGGSAVTDVGEGGILAQLVRLGALDGLNLQLRTWINMTSASFAFAGARGEANIPFTSQFGLFGAGGGAANGWAFGDVGVRTMLGGTGAGGTTVLSASLGYATISAGSRSAGGPTVAFGLEWRR